MRVNSFTIQNTKIKSNSKKKAIISKLKKK